MRQLFRLIVWLFFAALSCAFLTVFSAYVTTLLASIVFRFSFIDDPAAGTWLHGSMAVFALISLAVVTFLAVKLVRGEL